MIIDAMETMPFLLRTQPPKPPAYANSPFSEMVTAHISDKYVSIIMEETAKSGIATYKRIYGLRPENNIQIFKLVTRRNKWLGRLAFPHADHLHTRFLQPCHQTGKITVRGEAGKAWFSDE